MAALIAIGDGAGTVATNHLCDTTTTTDQCSSRVFVTGTGIVLDGHKNTIHSFPPTDSCPPHTVALTVFSDRVFSEGKGVGRANDAYGAETISGAGQNKVTAG